MILRRARRLAYSLFGHLPFSWKVFLNTRINAGFLVGLIGVVVNDRGELLVLRHTYRPAFPYGLPSGWLKRNAGVGGSPPREMRQETGPEVARRGVPQVESKGRPGRVDIWLRHEFIGGQFEPSDQVSEARFLPPEALPPLLPAQEDFIARNWSAIQRHDAPLARFG